MRFTASFTISFTSYHPLVAYPGISGIDDTYQEGGSPLFSALNKVKCDKSAMKILELLICSIIFLQERLNNLLFGAPKWRRFERVDDIERNDVLFNAAFP
jgi:hypothetical protein